MKNVLRKLGDYDEDGYEIVIYDNGTTTIHRNHDYDSDDLDTQMLRDFFNGVYIGDFTFKASGTYR